MKMELVLLTGISPSNEPCEEAGKCNIHVCPPPPTASLLPDGHDPQLQRTTMHRKPQNLSRSLQIR